MFDFWFNCDARLILIERSVSVNYRFNQCFKRQRYKSRDTSILVTLFYQTFYRCMLLT